MKIPPEYIQEARKELARRDLLAFTCYTMPEYQVNWHHRYLADKLTDFANGEIKRLIVTMPPRRGKSELASRRLPAFILGRNPDAKIIAASHGADLATDMSRDTKRIILADEYKELFPGTTLNPKHCVADDRQAHKNTADQWEIIGHKGGYLSRGVGGSVTGKGGNFLLLDDPVKDEEEARSVTHRERVWRWYNKVFRTRRAPGAGILVVMTRWHEDDLVGRLLEEQRTNPKADKWDLVELREIREADDNPDDPRDVGDVLWPEMFTLDEALADRSTDPAGFASLYQQRPSPEEGSIIKLINCQQRYAVLPDKPGEWIQAWDPKAGSKDPRSSYVSGQVWFRPAGTAQYYLVDRVHGRWEIDETMAQIEALSRRHPKALRKMVEAKADGKAIINLLKAKVPGLVAVSPQGDKATRLKAVSPFFEANNIYLPARSIAPWVDEFVHELTTFPGAPHDDDVDACSLALSHWIAPQTSNKIHRTATSRYA